MSKTATNRATCLCCPCSEEYDELYIGETKQALNEKMEQH